jgi:hypothetical protein
MQGKLYATQTNKQAGTEASKASVQNEFDKMSRVSFERVEKNMIERGSARDGDGITNK